MPLFANPYAQDAAAFGQQTGNALAQGLIQLPQERYQLARQNALLQQGMQRNQELNQYRQGLLSLRSQGQDNESQAREMANQIALLRAQIDMQRAQNMPGPRPFNTPNGTFLPPNSGTGITPFNTNNQPQINPQAAQPQGGGIGLGGATNTALQNPTGQPATMGGWSFMPMQRQYNPAQQMDAVNGAMRNYLGMLSMTNAIPQDMSNSIVNYARQAMAPYQQQQGLQQSLTNSAPNQTNQIGRFQVQQIQ
jgi:hypothetical protein